MKAVFPKTGHNDFDHRAGTGPGFFIITTGHEASGLWVVDGTHKDMLCSDKRKAKIVKASRLKLISIPENSVFVGHGFLQQAGAGWSGTPSLRYHMYLVPNHHPLKDAVAFPYGTSYKREDESTSSSSSSSSGEQESGQSKKASASEQGQGGKAFEELSGDGHEGSESPR